MHLPLFVCVLVLIGIFIYILVLCAQTHVHVYYAHIVCIVIVMHPIIMQSPATYHLTDMLIWNYMINIVNNIAILSSL